MKQKRIKRPVTASYEDIMFNEAGSANDCTGLIPSAVNDDSEYKSYEDIMDFDLPEMYKNTEGNTE
ncbi:MAG: hypothetical protein ACI4Q5_09010 [Porcipelethomonas sp.]